MMKAYIFSQWCLFREKDDEKIHLRENKKHKTLLDIMTVYLCCVCVCVCVLTEVHAVSVVPL